jgi:hypothetical protein
VDTGLPLFAFCHAAPTAVVRGERFSMFHMRPESCELSKLTVAAMSEATGCNSILHLTRVRVSWNHFHRARAPVIFDS